MAPWSSPPDRLELRPGHVHAWRVRVAAEAADRLRAVLDAEDLARAAAKRFERDRLEVLVSRGALRTILARYAGASPAELRFEAGVHGKPALAAPRSELRFNLSHSRGLALVAVCAGGEVGIDVEHEGRGPFDEGLARRVLAPRELALWRAAADGERDRLFLRAWTAKEACLKASGLGLGGEARSIEVLDASGGLRSEVSIPSLPERWSLAELDPGPGWSAAVAAAGPLEAILALDFA